MRTALTVSVVAIGLIVGGCFLSAQSPQQPIAITIPTQGVVTLDQLMKRMDELQKGLAQAQANVNAFQGALQETQHWIDLLKEQASKQAAAKK